DRAWLVLGRRQCHEPLTAPPLERVGGKCRVDEYVAKQIERRVQFVAQRLEPDRAALAIDVHGNARAERLLRVGELIAGSGRRALAEHLARERRDAKLRRVLELILPADKVDGDRHE